MTKKNKNQTNILVNYPCPLCNGYNDFVLAKKGFPNNTPLRNVICKTCGLIRISPRMTRKGYEEFYQKEFFDYLDPMSRPAYVVEIENTTKDNGETETNRVIMPFILPYAKQGGVALDIGAGFGQVLYFLKKQKGMSVVGLEPDPGSRKIAREKIGIDLLPITIEEYFNKNKNLKLDLVVMNQTFEHLLEPLDVLRGLAKTLTKDGVIFIGVPNAWDPLVSMELFYQVAHTFNYTPAVFAKFADRAGLKIVAMREYGALEVIMARKDSEIAELKSSDLSKGGRWYITALRLKRKEFLNNIRGVSKVVLNKIFGQKVTQLIRRFVDTLIRYKY